MAYTALIGIVLAFAIGYGCRSFDLPLPAPVKLIGALLVVAMTTGYVAMDMLAQGGYMQTGISGFRLD
ncbi:MAG: XapX domain-containing protein [Pseudomonadota bacterium]